MRLKKYGQIASTSASSSMNNRVYPCFSDGTIRIAPFCERHLTAKYVSWLNDPIVVRFSEQRHYKHTLQTCLDYFVSQQKSANYFLAIEHEDRAFGHVGNIGVTVDLNNNIADLAIIIGDKRVWGTGVGSRAWNAAIRTLIDTIGFRIVTAGTMEVNKPMVKLMKSSGMHIYGIIPRRFLWDGLEVGLVMASTP